MNPLVMSTLKSKLQRIKDLRPLFDESVARFEAAWDLRMVYESNAIEGNSLTIAETSDVLADFNSTKGSGKLLNDYTDAQDLGRAWGYVKEQATSGAELKESILRQISKILTGKAHSEMELAFSSSLKGFASAIGGSCTEPEYWGALLYDLPVDPVEKAARIHHRISRSSHFGRFNGRTARLAMNFVLLAAGYPPISIPTDLRKDYYTALEAADSGDFQTWQNFLTEQLDHELDHWLSALEDIRPKT